MLLERRVPHVVDAKGEIAHEERRSLWGPPPLGGLAAVGLGRHGHAALQGNQGEQVVRGSDSSLSVGTAKNVEGAEYQN